MGQYFKIVNLDKKEWIRPGGLKLWELCANNEIRMLGYLLATNNPDGTAIIKWFDDPEEAKKKYGQDFIILSYHKEHKLGFGMKPLKYFGHWCGDRIAIIGDYADKATNVGKDFPSYFDLDDNTTWKDITNEVAEEFNYFIEDDDLKVHNDLNIAPDVTFKRMGAFKE
jgi:hypothetical protein